MRSSLILFKRIKKVFMPRVEENALSAQTKSYVRASTIRFRRTSGRICPKLALVLHKLRFPRPRRRDDLKGLKALRSESCFPDDLKSFWCIEFVIMLGGNGVQEMRETFNLVGNVNYVCRVAPLFFFPILRDVSTQRKITIALTFV